MKRIFFAGDITNNNGPSNVNKSLYKYLKSDFIFLKSKNKLVFAMRFIIETILAETIIYSGILQIDKLSILLAKLLKKRVIYIMHGCVQFEKGLENNTKTLGGDILEEKIFHLASMILCVSEPFADWFKEFKPEYKEKTGILTNGIDWNDIMAVSTPKKKNVEKCIVLVGGGRKIKCNIDVIKAVELLNNTKKLKINVKVYGYYRDNDDCGQMKDYSFVSFEGMVEHQKLMDALSSADLFVQNSILEPFGLTPVEALSKGCSVLISKYVGCISILNVNETDRIDDPHNLIEIANKIEYLLENDNSERLLSRINKNETSSEYSAILLKSILE